MHFIVEPDRVTRLAARVDEGELRPFVGDVMPLDRGREAFERKSAPGLVGKVVLDVAGQG